ncbi:hypothetical protein [Sphingobacterium psychroaquaticum]|uniref:Uncharacterized protein n=1 Tax=Sphingobacterium psychroaquaticum TaxID=561061 RepID=A0A1X7JW73_9SPHI|nr:hypothetical protein [Sphingobacterium psychroaquaticum]SMG32507.1 hypothetical protein SAMN05660862_2258 [Sphingobacterium psychroaquaticum]
MARVILYLMICGLISSCGLFKRTEKATFTSKAGYSIERKDEVKGEVHSTLSTLEARETDRQSYSDGEHEITADEVHVDAAGNVSAKGGVSYKGKIKAGQTGKEKETFANTSTVDSNVTSTISENASNREVVKTTENKAEPSGQGIIYGAIAVLIVVLGVMYYLGIKRKK